ncbi:hypothetical protein B0E55_06412 [Rhodococcus sp. 66b]|nr:hypothetical protein B0E55_06412 [Rhodococcus sp. 66b]
MIAFSGCPTSCQYRRASFAAVSTESEPPEVKKILLPATGAIVANRSANTCVVSGTKSPKLEK